MSPAADRLIRQTISRGQLHKSQSLDLRVLPGSSQLVVIVGKSLSKKATVRNRTRRLVTEFLRSAFKSKLEGKRFVIRLKRLARDQTTAQTIRDELRAVFDRLD